MNSKNTINNFDKIEKTHQFEANRKYFVISIYAFCVIVLSVVAIYFLWHFGSVAALISDFFNKISEFIIGFFIAYFMNPIVKTAHNKLFTKLIKIKSSKLRIGLSILLSYVGVTALITVILIFIIPEVYESIVDLTDTVSNNIPAISDKCIKFIENLEKHFPWFDWHAVEEQIKTSMPHFMELTTNFLTYVVEKAISLSISLVSTLLTLLLAVTVSIYMILDKKVFAKNACRLSYALFSKERTVSLCRTLKDCNNIFYNFVIGKAIDSSIIFVITFIAMQLLDLKFSLLISIIVGITNMIPYFGPFIGAVPGILICLIVSPVNAIIFTILIIIIQQFDGLYLGPTILGGSVGIKPIMVILGITIGGAYGGPFGMFIGVPLTAIGAYLINKFITGRLVKKNITAADFKKVGL